MPITLLDLILLIVMLISGLLAMIRGFIREVLSIAAWGLAAIAGVYAYAKLLPMFKGSFGSDIVTTAVVVGGAFLLTLLVVSIITVRVSDMILDSRVGALDRTLGFVFGLARGLLIVVVGFLFFNWLIDPKVQPAWTREAKSRFVLEGTGNWLISLLPGDMDEYLTNVFHKRKKNDQSPPDAPPDQRSDNGGAEREGYNRTDTAQMQKLIERKSQTR